ncbi:MAG: PHP domain-containing protein [Chlamydiales bacterium]|nr:PHP domain-containing protein [Chlamydiales bacterium]
MFRADLHAHTTCSDGTFTPEELVSHAKEIGLSALCITDHDSIDAYPTAIPQARKEGLILVAGVEFSSVFQEMSVHILGYDILLDHPSILSLCKRHKLRRENRNRMILKKLASCGFSISEEELSACGSNLGRPHIAQLMVQKGYVPTFKHAFQNYLAEGKRCYASGEMIPAEETIETIHQAQGKAFLAHPHLMIHRRKIRSLLNLPFDGIECYYAKFPADKEKKWLRIAQERSLLASGGSDFHGACKEHIPLGCSWVEKEVFDQIFTRQL